MRLAAVGCAALSIAALAPLVAALAVVTVVFGVAAPRAGSGGSAVGAEAIPAPYRDLVVAAADRYAVPWPVLAAIYQLECDFGRSLEPGCNPPGTANPAGAQGPGQFLPSTWRRGLDNHQLIPLGPPTVDSHEGYATDGDGDGVADPWNAADAVSSTARLLAANGGTDAASVTGAIFAYNHDAGYVRRVLAVAAGFAAAAAPPGGP